MKLFVVKKGVLIAIAFIILFGICIGVYGQLEYGVSTSLPTIIIDAGHGGVDAGVRGKTSGVKESDLNLAISKYLYGYFSNAGFNAMLTRKTQGGLYGVPTKGFKARDMITRKKIITENDADMVISIHQNFYSASERKGGQVFYAKENENGKDLALKIQRTLNEMEHSGNLKILTGDYYILKCTQNPSVIVECGFLSNQDDERLLSTPEYQKAVAYAIFQGAISYFA